MRWQRRRRCLISAVTTAATLTIGFPAPPVGHAVALPSGGEQLQSFLLLRQQEPIRRSQGLHVALLVKVGGPRQGVKVGGVGHGSAGVILRGGRGIAVVVARRGGDVARAGYGHVHVLVALDLADPLLRYRNLAGQR